MPKKEKGNIEYYTSSLLDQYGIKHAWFTRVGGVSPRPFDSLNFSFDYGDKKDYVLRNRQLACEAIGLDADRLIFAGKLGHSNKVSQVDSDSHEKDVSGYDAIITTLKNIPISLCVADCVAVFIADVNGKAVSIVHVGWKGLVAGIIQHTVNKISQTGVKCSNLVAAIGPANQLATYEFSKSDLDPILQAFPNNQITKEISGKWYVDIPRGCEIKLKDCGISKIDNLGINSFLKPREFYSHRRDKPVTGRNGAIVSL